jgi:hypothetical protein
MPFQKGQSGNPGGRKPIPPEVKEALKAMEPRAVERLRELLESDDDKIAMAAVKEVLDRNLGKPPQSLEHSVGGDAQALDLRVRFVKPEAGEAAAESPALDTPAE